MRAFLPITIVTALAGGALAQTTVAQGQAGEIIRGLCQKDGCAEFVVVEKQLAAKGADGDLFRTRIATFHASNKGRVAQGEQNGFVYCSQTRPAVISTPAGQPPLAFLLAPDEQSPAWALRPTANLAATYFGVCHGPEAGRAAATDRASVGRSLGYQVPLEKSQTVTMGRAEDILQPATAPK